MPRIGSFLGIKLNATGGSKVTSADWIFYRILIERPDRSIPAPIATGKKTKTESPSINEGREFKSR